MSQIDDPKVAVGDGDEPAPEPSAASPSTTTGTTPRRGGAGRRPAAPGGRGGVEGDDHDGDAIDGGLDDVDLDDPTGEEAELLDVQLDDDLDDDLQGTYDEFWGEESGEAEEPGAATAAPVRKKSRHQKRKEWRQTERARRYAARRSVRFPIFTRSVLLWMLLFAMMGAAFGGSGAFFWAHFNTEIAELREQTTDFDKRSQEARAEIDAMRNQAITDINNQLKPIAPFLAEANTIKQAETVSPFVWFVATLDENGNPAVGSAFSVATDDTSTLMITSYNTVKAGAVNPAPPIGVRKGQEEISARVVSFDPDRDLALIEVQRANMPILEWASDADQQAALGLRVFPVSGLGGTGAALTSGIIIDQSGAGLLHTSPIGDFMQGGPIITADYKVIGVASIAYRPLGFDPGEIHFSVQINSVCAVLMECGGGARTKKP
jgi:S1-C subfamily serine protease